jgi:hypothetical protein
VPVRVGEVDVRGAIPASAVMSSVFTGDSRPPAVGKKPATPGTDAGDSRQPSDP